MTTLTPRLDNYERNLIINGNMDFQQRGNSGTANNTYNYGIDRFAFFRSSVNINIPTLTRDTDVPTLAQSGFQSAFSYKLVTNGSGASPGVGELYYLAHKLEGFDYQNIHGKKVRLQFWIKSSLTGSFSVVFTNSAQNRSYVAPYSISSTNTWEKKTIDLQMDTAGTWLFDTGLGLMIEWPLTTTADAKTTSSTGQWLAGQFNAATGQTNFAGTATQSLWLSQVMLIPQDLTAAGSSTIDIPFQRAGRSIGHELQMCQRYCWVDGADDAQNGENHMFGLGKASSGTASTVYSTFPITMRGTPTMTLSAAASTYQMVNAADSSNPTCSAVTLSTAGPKQALVTTTVASGLTAGNMTMLTRANGNTTSMITWDAEL